MHTHACPKAWELFDGLLEHKQKLNMAMLNVMYQLCYSFEEARRLTVRAEQAGIPRSVLSYTFEIQALRLYGNEHKIAAVLTEMDDRGIGPKAIKRFEQSTEEWWGSSLETTRVSTLKQLCTIGNYKQAQEFFDGLLLQGKATSVMVHSCATCILHVMGLQRM